MSVSNSEDKKKIILTAAADIVKEEGVAKLTLEAVAKKAGLSKGGLLYHYSSKEALIIGMVQDWTYSYFNSIESLVKNNTKSEVSNWTSAYIQATFSDLNHDKRLSSALIAAMFTNPSLLEEYKKEYDILLGKLMNDGIDPIKVTIVRLAIDGLWFSEIFDLAPLDENLKNGVINELNHMIKEEE
ncbi:TetR family transcriptional regulator [Bacillus sp. FJAT-49705]|uniref:TetR family transcriptional regulator n=1 Tax=Cytobacillus citreus TaxID=2833586 RepID=A0ABS5NZS3_9BACI|nr:TetR family transcriptional regulator [Cytobacillus citreus]MBS4192899.1 TetR family transcriptional regulator [Cytobacillus citreus]